MGADYYNDFESTGKAKPKSFLMWMVDGFMSLLTIGVGILMLLTIFVPYIHPGHIWFFPAIGLLAPAIYLFSLLLAFFWIIRWNWKHAGAMILMLLLGYGNMSLIYRVQVRRSYDNPELIQKGAIKIMSYNVRNFCDDHGKVSIDSIARFIDSLKPDIVCLQESTHGTAKHPSFEKIRKNYSATTGKEMGFEGLMLIMATNKYKILNHGESGTDKSSIWADLLINEDTIRVFNNHLHTTEIKAADNEYLTHHHYLNDSMRDEKIRSILRRHWDNSTIRAQQVDSLVPRIAEHKGMHIVCGDFNDTPISYVYRQMSQGMTDAFKACGNGYSHTYRGFRNTLRIDYILYSKGLKGRTYDVPDVNWSDHHPVVVHLIKEKHK